MKAPNWWVRRSKNRIDRLWRLMDRVVYRIDRLELHVLSADLQARVERLEDQAPIHIVGNTEDAQRAIASLVAQLDDANAHIRRLTQENAA